MKRIPFVLLAVAALMAVFASSASATDQGPYQRLRVHTLASDGTTATDGSFARWQTFPRNGDDSPLDANARALVVHLLPGDYTEVYTRASANLNKPASQIKNLSFDSYLPADHGGAPRIVVYFANPLSDGSDHVFIDAQGCNYSIGGDWVRTDPTGRTAAGCTITGSSGGTWSSDGTNTAWQNLVADNPNAVVAFTFMVFDQATTTINTATGQPYGNYRVDRISLGTNRMFTYSNYDAVSCNFSEAAC